MTYLTLSHNRVKRLDLTGNLRVSQICVHYKVRMNLEGLIILQRTFHFIKKVMTTIILKYIH